MVVHKTIGLWNTGRRVVNPSTHARRRPEHPAVVLHGSDDHLTYRQLDEDADMPPHKAGRSTPKARVDAVSNTAPVDAARSAVLVTAMLTNITSSTFAS